MEVTKKELKKELSNNSQEIDISKLDKIGVDEGDEGLLEPAEPWE